MNLPSKISKTKKRLSSNVFFLKFSAIYLLMVFYFFVLFFHFIKEKGNYGVIPIVIPSFTGKYYDPSHSFKENSFIDSKTAVIELNQDNFSVGNLEQMTKNFHAEKETIFFHKNKSLQILNLIKVLKDLKGKKEISNDRVALLVPGKECTIEMIAEVINTLQKSKIFEDIVLAGGYL